MVHWKKDILTKYEDEFDEEVDKIFDEAYIDLLQITQDCAHDLIITMNLHHETRKKK